ncbi:MAG: O-antigen ligase family protein [Sphaerochaeta sp.]|nr:O-antigen ligase family protein [Sphaerochaeta sp.]
MSRIGRVHLNFEDNMIISLFLLYVIMKPFYFWRSGLPQPADFIFIVLIFIVLLRVDVRRTFSYFARQKIVVLALLFVFWIFTVNSVWTIILSNPRILFPTVFYFYNVMVFIIVLILVHRYGQLFLNKFFLAVVLSVSIQFVLFLAAGGFGGGRETANFNNPNQLGYYGLLALVSVFYVQSKIYINKVFFIFAAAASFTLLLASLSKAAIVSALALLLLHLIFQLTNVRNRMFMIILTIIILVMAIFISGFDLVSITDSSLLDTVNRRLQSIGQDSDDSLEGRGYDRIFDHPEYWIFGSGEGNNSRFTGLLGNNMEFHSTLGNIQVSYGIIGTILFLSILLFSLKRNNYADWYLIFALLVYGLTHNGIRNTLFWILLALLNFTRYENC